MNRVRPASLPPCRYEGGIDGIGRVLDNGTCEQLHRAMDEHSFRELVAPPATQDSSCSHSLLLVVGRPRTVASLIARGSLCRSGTRRVISRRNWMLDSELRASIPPMVQRLPFIEDSPRRLTQIGRGVTERLDECTFHAPVADTAERFYRRYPDGCFTTPQSLL